MDEYISRKAAIAYIREQSEECQKAFEELGGESGIYADAYNDLAEDFYRIPAVDVAPVVHAKWDENGYCTNCGKHAPFWVVSSCYYKSPYCQSCGAKMDGGADNEAD